MINKKILIVDDEPDLVKAVQIRLKQAGYEVIVAYDGVEGLEKTRTEKIGLILLDILMPQMDGFEILKKLKEDSRTKDIPVIMLTAKSQLESVTIATNLGVEDYIVKPFDYISMLGKIKDALVQRKD